ncbi:hypothetical protein C0992_002938 [Termitomyces sp. T32_za158]|nr:hypothetical protein C0992_002938 [Termitomyces sp. T32_za158]
MLSGINLPHDLLVHLHKTVSTSTDGHSMPFQLGSPTGTLSPEISKQLFIARDAAHELRDICASKVWLSEAETQKLRAEWNVAHAEQFRLWAEHAVSRARDAAKKAKLSILSEKSKRPTFNHVCVINLLDETVMLKTFPQEYTPLLDKYFEYNAYPSAPDRAVLARKSMMTLRQIEVWFQNHRNRAKKEGRPLRKLTHDPLPLEISLKSLEYKMPHLATPEHDRKLTRFTNRAEVSSDEENSALIIVDTRPVSDILDPPRPDHAFPSIYKPSSPLSSDQSNFRLQWHRKPVVTRRVTKVPIDMDDFIAQFREKLHLRAPLSNFMPFRLISLLSFPYNSTGSLQFSIASPVLPP